MDFSLGARAMSERPTVLDQLLAVIRDRHLHRPERSYTTALLAGGVEKMGAKIVEEAAEVVEAAAETGAPGRQHLVHEAADLVYHLLVLLRFAEVEWQDVEAELARRFGVSGLEEKAARTTTPNCGDPLTAG
jgi:phosphoribosyl-ATP pyrophosphohydrolase